MVAGLRWTLTALGLDVNREVAQSRLVLSSDSFASSGGEFDVSEKLRQLEGALDQALSDGYAGLWATGDMTWEFGSEKSLQKLVEYEFGLEGVFRRRKELSGICQYHRDTLPPVSVREAVLTHPAVFINETLSWMNPKFIASGDLADRQATDAELTEAADRFAASSHVAG